MAAVLVVAFAVPAAVANAFTIRDSATVGYQANRGTPTQVRVLESPWVPTPPPTPTDVFNAINAVRAEFGLPALMFSATVANAAQVQANYVSELGQLTHFGPSGGAGDRLRAAGFHWTAFGEALAAGAFVDGAALVRFWLDSPGHRAILLGNFQYVGVAMAQSGDEYYWCVVTGNGA